MVKKHCLRLLLIIFFLECIFFLHSSKQAHFPSSNIDKKPLEKELQTILTIERIFSSSHQAQELPQTEIWTIIVTGDVLLARSVNYQMHQKRNFKYSFEKTAAVLKNADMTFINLENPFFDGCSLTSTGMVFCGSLEGIEGLLFAGVDIASLANNHTRDWGENGLKSTIEILNKNNIAVAGLGEILIKEVRGLKFAFLGFDLIKSFFDEAEVLDQVKKAKNLADVVVVYFHWGIEYTDQPTQNQRSLAYKVIDNGANLIIGSHPHWIQGVEIYKNKLIVYSHGNFIFDQIWSEETKKGIVGKYTFYRDQLIDVEFLPVFMREFAQPQFLSGKEKQAVLDEMKQRSIID